MQKISSFHQFIIEKQQILESKDLTKKTTHIFDHQSPKIIKETFSFPEFVSTYEQSVYSITCFFRYSQFQSPETRVPTPIFDHAHPIFFKQLLISMNLHQHAKNQAFLSFCSRDRVDLKFLHFDWPRTFLHISQKPRMCKNIANNIKFCYRPNLEQIND